MRVHFRHLSDVTERGSLFVRAIVILSLIGALASTAAEAQVFSSGSDGSDGAYAPSGPPGTVINFDPSQFSGTQVSSNIFNFTTITIPQGITVRLSANKMSGAVYWLAQGDVRIEGTLDASGAVGAPVTSNPFQRNPASPGPGGYTGGVGGNSKQVAFPGSGPVGGIAGDCRLPPPGGNGAYTGVGLGGSFSGNQFLIPLVGGSGGGGSGTACDTIFGAGGGAGGGAILIASSTQITVQNGGYINVSGGSRSGDGIGRAGGGGGGAVRLVANVIFGQGGNFGQNATLDAGGGQDNGSGFANGGPGVIRLEAASITWGGRLNGTVVQSGPFPLLLPTAGTPSAKVISIGGVSISPNPNTFPDITINSATAVPVVIQTHNIPISATINLTILDQNGAPDTVMLAPPLGNCDQNNVCTTAVNVIFPFGASRGLTKVTWTP